MEVTLSGTLDIWSWKHMPNKRTIKADYHNFPPLILNVGTQEGGLPNPHTMDRTYQAAIELMKEKSLKEDTGKRYRGKIKEATAKPFPHPNRLRNKKCIVVSPV